ncbi:succinylglutamate desuccinylase [Vibrio mangrovi]|uniref:Succinylglutamate desuccinylase n=1 Tax=Vibrio mangrovi TaxID=474394 RepID=A0A1Y6IY41_9VIBR|nr:succinylglutamate desuccinylase [Vibrio mangrovi]MDW6005222.1 succinylglutamate desuccinylase [Vibrio mangrovi]SMS02568.1 Succinylglutamate desuccinylase [Vibrio mangrovi]
MKDFLQTTLQGQTPEATSGDNANLIWRWLTDGVLLLEPKIASGITGEIKSVLMSAGVHGNETAPIEILSRHVNRLLAGEMPLAVRLLVVLGNPKAIRAGVRYQTIDLNRLFNGHHRDYPVCDETTRAVELENIVEDFFADVGQERFHFDLHTAIRESFHIRFGLLPQKRLASDDFLQGLIGMGLEALVINPIPGGTFSYYTHAVMQVQSCTLELGKARPFGENDLTQFAAADKALGCFIRGETFSADMLAPIKVYQVARELKKLSDDFHFIDVSDDAKNFTSFAQGALIAQDGDVTYRVERANEWLIFPNAGVKSGLRAGLMLAEADLDALM